MTYHPYRRLMTNTIRLSLLILLSTLSGCASQKMQYANPFVDPLFSEDKERYQQKSLVMYRVTENNSSKTSRAKEYQRIDFLLFDFSEK